MGIQSFSSLTRQIDFNGADLDGGTQLWAGVSDEESLSPDPIFDFPAGAHAGNFMHDVFEHLEFDDSTTWAGLLSGSSNITSLILRNGKAQFTK